MLERLTSARRNLALALLGLLLLWGAWTVRSVLNPLLLGYLLAYIVHPMVLQLERAGWRRRSAVNAIFAAAGVSGLLLAGALFVQGRDLTLRLAGSDVFVNAELRLRDSLNRVELWLDDSELALGEELSPGADSAAPGGGEVGSSAALEPTAPRALGASDGAAADAGADAGAGAGPAQPAAAAPAPGEGADEIGIGQLLSEFWSRLSEEQSATAKEAAVAGAGGIWRLLTSLFGSLLAFGALVILLPVYTYFLLFELGRIHRFVLRYLPIRERLRLARVGRQLGEVLANFFRGRLLVCLFKGLALALGLWIVGVDYALLLGLGSGFLSLVPFVGPLIGFLAAFLVGLLEIGDFGPLGLVLRLALVFGLAEGIEGYVLLPKILGDTLGLHPVVVLASVMVGGAALGIFGFLMALPLTAGAILLVREFVLPALEDFADEEAPSGPQAEGQEGTQGREPARPDAGGGELPAAAATIAAQGAASAVAEHPEAAGADGGGAAGADVELEIEFEAPGGQRGEALAKLERVETSRPQEPAPRSAGQARSGARVRDFSEKGPPAFGAGIEG